jgi:hypothetical protein
MALLVVVGTPEFNLAAFLRDADQRKSAVSTIQNYSKGYEYSAPKLWVESGLVVAPF